MAKYRYAIVVRGFIEANSQSNAYMQLLMGLSLNGRMLRQPHELAVDVREVNPKPVEAENAQDAAEAANQEGPLPAGPPFVEEPDGS